MGEQEIVSTFFSKSCYQSSAQDISEDFLQLKDELNMSLEHFKLPTKVDCVYNPTIYARNTFEEYVRKYCNNRKPILYFGMNPGPWGMSQTGVPFGEISSVRDWLGIEGPVSKPPKEIKARPVNGFQCTRSEISGKRFWGLFRDLCGTPDIFFKTSFVYNYLPQQWMTSTGCNLTPGDFKVSEMENLYNICDPVFSKVLELYEVEKIIAVGKFCESRAQKTLKKYPTSRSIEILYLPHPSPRTVNNNNWHQKAIEFLETSNMLQYYRNRPLKNSDPSKMADFMNRALELASEALAAQEVPVGCVFTTNSDIVAEARNSVNATHNPTRHAEINCIDYVLEYCKTSNIDYRTYFKNITVYVTVEPCIMCAGALNNLNVREVIYGCANDRFGGKTVLDVSNFYETNYVLNGNLLADEAMALLKQFYKGTNPNAPEGKLKKDKKN